MDGDVQIVLIANIFRVFCLIAGLGFGYLGYKLYVKGVFDKTQDIKASFGNAKVALRHVAPGVVFGVAGIIIAVLGVIRPIKTEQRSLTAPAQAESRFLFQEELARMYTCGAAERFTEHMMDNPSQTVD